MIREAVATVRVTFELRIRGQWPGSEVHGGARGLWLGLGVSGCGWGSVGGWGSPPVGVGAGHRHVTEPTVYPGGGSVSRAEGRLGSARGS